MLFPQQQQVGEELIALPYQLLDGHIADRLADSRDNQVTKPGGELGSGKPGPGLEQRRAKVVEHVRHPALAASQRFWTAHTAL